MSVEAATVTLAHSDDNLYIAGSTKTTISSAATFTGAGRLYGLSGSSIVLKNDTAIGVRLRAHGNLTIEEGSVGKATVNSDFALGSTGTFLVEASGNGACDLLDVNGTAFLNGILAIDFTSGYTPADGDSFRVLEYGARSGTFDGITWTGAFNLIPFYGEDGLTLTVSVPEPSTWVLLVSSLLAVGFFRREKL